MAPKRKYGALEAPSQPTHYELRERTAQGKVVRVIQRKNFQPSLQDPFHVLGDHEVRHIINLLEARDTETLRRVSRLWKTSAEYHCERSLLLQHFPWMAPKMSQSTTREELNLLFRRCLYHQESLKAGLATRAIKFSGARRWHIRDSHVVWSNVIDSISTRLLRSPKASSSKSEITRLEVKKLVPKGYEVKFVQAVSKDEILVTAQTHKINENLEHIYSQKLILISLFGKTKWVFDIENSTTTMAIGENSTTRPAIGRTSLYTINARIVPALTGLGHIKISLIKLSLSTGSIEMDKVLPISNNRSGIQLAITPSEEYLILSLEETFAMRNQAPISTGGQHIFCTTTGSLVYSYTNNHHRTIDMAATPSITQNGIWAYGFPHTRLTQQNPLDKSWVTHEIHLPKLGPFGELGFDGDRCLFSHLIHSETSEPLPSRRWNAHTYKRRISKFGVSTAIREPEVLAVGETSKPSDVSYTTSLPSLVTLPDGNGGRRELEIKLPWSDISAVYYRDFFGFLDGYIVYHNRWDELLLLMDFRPDW